MTPVDEFRASVSEIISVSHLEAPDDGVTVDGMTPELVVAPGDEDELARVLAEARTSGLAVIPVGGGTHLGAGNVPESYDVALSTLRLNETLEHEPDDLTVTVDAGVLVSDLEARLAERGQFLPINPPYRAGATLGGLIATNGYGPLRHAYGTLRDWLIGLRVAQADGTVTKSGGRVVKNVSGYDMHKLHIGALGTLGVVTQATFKLAPLPAEGAFATVTFDSARAAAALVFRARDEGLALIAAETLSPAASNAVTGSGLWCAMLRLAGSHAAVKRTARDLRAAASELGGDFDLSTETNAIAARWHAAFAAAPLSMRLSVQPSQVAETIDVLDRRFAGAAPMLSATVSAGLIRANLEPGRIRARTIIDHALDAVQRRGGSLIIDAAPPALKREIDVFGPQRGDFPIMRRLKEQFDPQRVLSPGRFVGRL